MIYVLERGDEGVQLLAQLTYRMASIQCGQRAWGHREKQGYCVAQNEKETVVIDARTILDTFTP